jgi:hypothetical protein
VPGATFPRERIRDTVLDGDCEQLNTLGSYGDGNGGPYGQPATYGLQALRDQNTQPSDPEAVLDHVVYNLCKDKGAEVPEDGSG